MKRSRPLRSSPAKLRAWRRRSVERYEDRLRQEHDCPFRDIGTNRARRQRERERAYGPEKRREWLTRQPCVACGRAATEDRPNHQHHTRTGGMGRKADADTLVSVCPDCHRKHHDGHELDVDWEREARRTNERWEAETEREDR